MVDLFAKAMAFVWAEDNDGQPFHMSANDPGGATAWGVTFQTWAGWMRMHQATPSMAAFKDCKQADFLPLYRSMFWNACSCGSMGAIGIQVFDAAVNCGPGHSAEFLQTVLDLRVDGQIGPITLMVAQQTDQRQLARQLCAQREEFYATRPGARYFQRGWDARAERCRDLVLGMYGVPLEGASNPDAWIPMTEPQPQFTRAAEPNPDAGIPATEQKQGVTRTADDLNAAELARVRT